MNYFKSKDVKIFPCYSRGTYTQINNEAETIDETEITGETEIADETEIAKVFDPEARLLTESNFTNIYGSVLGHRSYIIGVKDNIAKFVIDGYYFEISNFNQDIQDSFTANNFQLWIKLEPISLTKEGVDTYRTTYALASLQSDTTALDTFVEAKSYYECTAIGYSTTFNPGETSHLYRSLDWNNGLNITKLGLGAVNVDKGQISLKLASDSGVLSQDDSGLSIDLSGYRTAIDQDVIDNDIKGRLDILEDKPFDTYATKTEFQEVAEDLSDYETSNNTRVKAVEDIINDCGDIVTHNAAEFEEAGAAAAAEGRINTKLESYYTKTEADAAFTTPAEVIAEVNNAFFNASDAGTINNITALVKYVNEHGGDLTKLIKEVYGSAEMTGDSRLDVIESKSAMGITDNDIDNWNAEIGAKVIVDANKETWNKAGTALQATDLTEYAKTADVVTNAEFETFGETNTAAINKLDTDLETIKASYVTTGEVSTAKQEAIDAAKEYANGLEHKNTTYTAAATENALEFTLTPSEGEAQTITLGAPTLSISESDLDEELKSKLITTDNYFEKIPVATASTSGLMSTEDKAKLDAKLDQSDLDNFATNLYEDNGFIANVASKLDGNKFKVYAVAFDANGGKGIMQPQISIGENYKLPSCSFEPCDLCHSFIGWEMSAAAGTTLAVGTECTLTENTTFYALWENCHNYDEGVFTTEPTCTTEGVKTFTCTVCGGTKTELVEALGHDEVNHEAKAPTCTEIGWDAYITCSRCDYTTQVEKAVLGHSYGDWSVLTEPTESDEGQLCRTCNNDSEHIEYHSLPTLSHDNYDYNEDTGYTYTIDEQKFVFPIESSGNDGEINEPDTDPVEPLPETPEISEPTGQEPTE